MVVGGTRGPVVEGFAVGQAIEQWAPRWCDLLLLLKVAGVVVILVSSFGRVIVC